MHESVLVLSWCKPSRLTLLIAHAAFAYPWKAPSYTKVLSHSVRSWIDTCESDDIDMLLIVDVSYACLRRLSCVQNAYRRDTVITGQVFTGMLTYATLVTVNQPRWTGPVSSCHSSIDIARR